MTRVRDFTSLTNEEIHSKLLEARKVLANAKNEVKAMTEHLLHNGYDLYGYAEKGRRNWNIFRRFAKGEKFATLAKHYDLFRERVRGICMRMKQREKNQSEEKK